jgi:Ycf4
MAQWAKPLKKTLKTSYMSEPTTSNQPPNQTPVVTEKMAGTVPKTILVQPVLGSRRFSNYFWAGIVTLGGVGFLLESLSSFLHTDLLPLVENSIDLPFFPQGVAMGFYGVAGTLTALYLWGSIALDIGGGYNEFNHETGESTIFRWGFPGKNRQIEVKNSLQDIQAVRVDIKDGINPRRTLFIRVKGRREIPLTRVGEPISLAEIETQGAELARFLGIPLEGL